MRKCVANTVAVVLFATMPCTQGLGRLGTISLVCIVCLFVVVVQLLFVYETTHRRSTETPSSPLTTAIEADSSCIRMGMEYEIFSVPIVRTLLRFEHWTIILKTGANTGRTCSLGMWADFSTDPVTIYLTCPDVHYFNSSRRLNVASSAVTSKDAYLGRPMRSFLTGAKEFVGNLNAVQMDIFQTVMNSEHVDANGIRLCRLDAEFTYFGLESILMPLRGVSGVASNKINCQLTCVYFHQRPERLRSLLRCKTIL